ncbi:MAG TPA: methylated-DNA--[protein]-cysteine S-methyltransferase [Natronosporangium sp.]
MNITTITTPARPLTIVATDEGVVRAAGFGLDASQLVPASARRRPDLGDITKAVRAYLDGDLAAIDDVPVEQPGGAFLQAAWQALRASRPGEPLTYTELAARAGNPAAVRAAANACARNQVALFVPCHRVLRLDGGLGGYRWGTGVKQWLLAHERAHAAALTG